jgi:YVTN family beta-propeller protein
MMRIGAAVRSLSGVLLLGGLFLGEVEAWANAPARGNRPAKTLFRRPAALVLADGGAWLFVANHRSGSIRVIDTSLLRTLAEAHVGRSLADLAISPADRSLLAVDEGANELIVLTRQGPLLSLAHRVPVALNPVSVQVTGDGSRCFVASLWARQVSEVNLRSVPPTVARTIALPFAPREQLLVSDAKLAVADAFGGWLAVIDTGRGEVDSVRGLPAHNIRGLALSHDDKELWVAHQAINGRASTSFDDVHWGNLITNNLRVLPLEDVLKPEVDLLRASRVHYLGDAGNAAGDPARLAVSRDGAVVVPLAGVGEVALGRVGKYHWQRVPVGRRPTAVVVNPDGSRAYVANQFTDSVSVIDLWTRKVTATLSLGPQPDPSASDRGELLFYDARLAHDGWMSCHSCHTDGHTNGLLADTLGDDSFGAPKRVLSLLGVRDTAPYAWNGSMSDLESQVRKSILTTMHGPKPSEEQVADLTAYLRTLPPPPPRPHSAGSGQDAAVRRGREVFRSQACDRCHTPPEYTSKATYDVGLKDEVGNTHFNPPSLRGVSQGGRYFHDNRAATLAEVFTRYRHQLPDELSRQQLVDLLAFLGTL